MTPQATLDEIRATAVCLLTELRAAHEDNVKLLGVIQRRLFFLELVTLFIAVPSVISAFLWVLSVANSVAVF